MSDCLFIPPRLPVLDPLSRTVAQCYFGPCYNATSDRATMLPRTVLQCYLGPRSPAHVTGGRRSPGPRDAARWGWPPMDWEGEGSHVCTPIKYFSLTQVPVCPLSGKSQYHSQYPDINPDPLRRWTSWPYHRTSQPAFRRLKPEDWWQTEVPVKLSEAAAETAR